MFNNKYSAFLILIITFIITFSGFFGNAAQCSPVTCDPKERSYFRAQRTYVYYYEAKTVLMTNISNVLEENKAVRFLMAAVVELEVVSPCEINMAIKNAQLSSDSVIPKKEATDFEEFSSNISKHKLNVHLKDRKVVKLCTEAMEPPWILNFKRGIISALQYHIDEDQEKYTIFERDIHGLCKSEYSTRTEGERKVVTRKRFLNDCSHRGGPISPAKIEDEELYVYLLDSFKSVQECSYTLDPKSHPVTVDCKEYHNYHPHISNRTLVDTHVSQVFVLLHDNFTLFPVQRSSEQLNGLQETRMFIDFQYKEPTVKVETFQEVINQAANKHYTDLMYLSNGNNFISIMKTVPYQQLLDAFYKLNARNVTGYSYMAFQEALLRAKSSDCIKVLVELGKNGFKDKIPFVIWFPLIFMINNPTKETLVSLQDMLELETTPKNFASLGISSLVNTYCRINPDCAQEQEVQFYINYWDSEILSYDEKKADQYDLINPLLAIGNIGQTNASPTIKKIIKDTSLPTIVRSVAIQALRKMQNAANAEVMEVLNKTADDSEIRVMAYIIAVGQFPENLLEEIETILHNEDNNEVTSFIWDHLGKYTSDSEFWKSRVKEILKNEELIAKFQNTTNNYSTYYENYGSYKTLNSRTSASGITIYKDNVPKLLSAGFNLAIFDHDVDNLEIWGMMRNIESVIHKIIPSDTKTPIQENNIKSKVSSKTKKNSSKESEKLDDIKSYDEIYFKLRLMNNDIVFLNDIMGLEKMFQNFQNYEGPNTFGPDEQLLVSTSTYYNFPTGIGIPLNYSLSTDVLVFYNATTNIEINEPLKSFIKMDFNLMTTVKVLTTGRITLDCNVAKRGLKGWASLDTDVTFSGGFVVQDKKLSKFAFNMSPKRVFTVSSEIKQFE